MYQQFIQSSLQNVSDIANAQFGKVTNTTKAGDNNQVLTQTDLEIGKTLIQEIETVYPDHNIIDEEAGVIDKKSDFTWVVDPIDGTSNFANGVPTYGVMIGLLEKNVPIAGGIALPAFQQIITAEKGAGTLLNGQKISVTSESSLLKTLVSYGIDGHQENPQLTFDETKILAQIVLNIRNLRSSNSVFDIIMVAQGKYGAMLNRTSKIWDNVAQHIIIEEAGGVYTDFFGQAIDYSNPLTKTEQNFTFCAASPTLHKKLQEIISSDSSSN